MARKSSDNNVEKVYRTIPASETGARTTCKTKSGNEYLITNDSIKSRFTLWRIVDGGYEKISVSSSPLDFDNIIPYQK